jgi:Na+/H+ antiporter NhaD/arsenite permease-like protein
MSLGYTPNPWMIAPFGILLATIALAPLFFPNWWSRRFPVVAGGLGAITLVYYVLILPAEARPTVVHTTHEYISFIALVGSLFVVSGGIHIGVKGEATPLLNVVFLGIGALVANVLGTTGASMLLIRPWLRMNKYRITAHHVVFFIFIVSNVGGCLTPIGDPPLFLGYLKGIPFWWVVKHCWQPWATGLAVLLVLFYVIDCRNFRRAPKEVREEQTAEEKWRFDGLINLIFLATILGAVFVEKPRFLREALMLGAAVGSYFATPKAVHAANHFNFHPIREVAILFIGIFLTMMPALDWLQVNAGKLGAPSAAFYYWGSGTLSSFLDNAPTYLSFLNASFGALVPQEAIEQVRTLVHNGGADLGSIAEPARNAFLELQRHHRDAVVAHFATDEQIKIAYLLGNGGFNQYIVAVSVGAVFFGANTYIGNGPNFMVKSIAEHTKVRVPSFLGYIFKFSLPFMIPMLLLVWWIFFRT